MPDSDSLALLERALDQTGAIIDRVRLDQASLPTPCTEWNVRQLINHTVYDLHVFTSMVTGAERGSPDADLIGADWSAAYRQAADALLREWRQRGTAGTMKSRIGELPATWAVGQHYADIAMHGWDVAVATGQSTIQGLDPDLGQASLDWARENLKPQLRGKAFGPEVEAPQQAPVYDRLAAFFGRQAR